jgi:hypothetical protein
LRRDAADRFPRHAQKCRQPLDPLVEKLSAVYEDERIHAALCDEPRSDDRLAERRGCRQHADVMLRERVCGGFLFGSQLAAEGDVDRRATHALVPDRWMNAERLEHLLNVVEAASRQRDVMRVILRAGDDARLVVG